MSFELESGEIWCPAGQHWVEPAEWSSNGAARCRDCNRRFAREWRDRNRDWLNASRRADYAEARGSMSRKCPTCGKTFTAGRVDQLHCSRTCRDRASYLRRKENAA